MYEWNILMFLISCSKLFAHFSTNSVHSFSQPKTVFLKWINYSPYNKKSSSSSNYIVLIRLELFDKSFGLVTKYSSINQNDIKVWCHTIADCYLNVLVNGGCPCQWFFVWLQEKALLIKFADETQIGKVAVTGGKGMRAVLKEGKKIGAVLKQWARVRGWCWLEGWPCRSCGNRCCQIQCSHISVVTALVAPDNGSGDH